MSAPTINAAAPPSTGPATGIGAAAAAAQATGPLAGFEALLAALFGAQGAAVAGQGGQATTKPAGAAGVLATDDPNVSGDGTATTDDPSTAAADAAAAAACNAALILPVAGQPIAATPVTADTDDAVEGVAAQATASGKSFIPAFASAAKDGTVGVDADPTAAAADPDPNAAAAAQGVKTAKINASAPQPAAAPQAPTTTAPAPVVPPPQTPVAPPVAPPATAALAAPLAAVDAKPADQAPVAAPKDKPPASKAGSGQHARIDVAAPGQAKTPPVAPATTDVSPQAAGGDDTVHALTVDPASTDAKVDVPDTPAGSADTGAATASTTNAATQVHPGAIPVRGAPQTVANLAAQIAKKLEGRSTHFDVQLDPAGLGRVDVRMEIGASGRMTAAMTFDTPQAAAELRARAADLQRHLEQAGFDMSGGLSFDVAGDRGQGRQAQQNPDNDSGQAFRGRAFQQALATAGQADHSAATGALNLRRSLLSGIDIRI
jgi:hypothetical protein